MKWFCLITGIVTVFNMIFALIGKHWIEAFWFLWFSFTVHALSVAIKMIAELQSKLENKEG